MYCDLTGTPYLRVRLMSHNHIIDVLSFKPDEKIVTSYGLFKSPDDEHKVYVDNKYEITYDISDFKPLILKKKSLNQKVKEQLRFSDIIIEYEPLDDTEKQQNNQPLIYIADKISPQEFLAMNESESIIAVSKPKKEASNMFTTQNLMIIGLALFGGFLAFNYMTRGRLF
jgi:hypothetical protein